MNCDVCIIGGGAAGLMAAISAKTASPEASVLILEKLPRVGKKISVTGNGRCNITNKRADVSNYHGKNPSFILSAFKQFTLDDTERFFEQIGTPIIYEGDKGYPASLQAASVTDALRFRCDELGVVTECEQKVCDIKKQGDGYLVITDKCRVSAKALICSAGMLSGGEKLGSDGAVFGILKNMGIKTVTPSPAIVQIKTDTEYVRQLKGIKVDTFVTVKDKNGNVKRNDFGEVLFCDYGISGPPVLQVSGDCENGDIITLDLMPRYEENTLFEALLLRKKNLKNRTCDEFLSGFINKRLGQVVLKMANVPLTKSVDALNNKEIKDVCRILKDFSLFVRGNGGFINSQVTKGGLLCDDFYDDTLMCKKHKGLFAVGEILDIDGDCGGFNLQWAWSSGFVAGRAAAKYTER
ncbi:MAG: aminoacetone oxidase family FAD-binding enzyme [Clostridia bacterium]|nr:aminoacetone oxidase family FAD-binding enzyme [Clostridia bacterium]MBQ5901241.1 aminoacetone oxidase family FAD-binding enzyme [Clostridia bacterium]